MRHPANADGTLVSFETRIVLDGGAYRSSSFHGHRQRGVLRASVRTHAQRPRGGWAVRTNNPPCGAMRGFGAVQTCFAHEAQMDKLAVALGVDPVELRLKNAMKTGDEPAHRSGDRRQPPRSPR